jgi:hypothetical protein
VNPSAVGYGPQPPRIPEDGARRTAPLRQQLDSLGSDRSRATRDGDHHWPALLRLAAAQVSPVAPRLKRLRILVDPTRINTPQRAGSSLCACGGQPGPRRTEHRLDPDPQGGVEDRRKLQLHMAWGRVPLQPESVCRQGLTGKSEAETLAEGIRREIRAGTFRGLPAAAIANDAAKQEKDEVSFERSLGDSSSVTAKTEARRPGRTTSTWSSGSDPFKRFTSK